MSISSPEFSVSGPILSFPGPAAWHYLAVDDLDVPPVPPRGWGSIQIQVTLSHATWQTSMFPLKTGGYFIPIKKSILRQTGYLAGDTVTLNYHACFLLEFNINK